MYYVGYLLGLLWHYKWYVLGFIVYWNVLAKLEVWLNFDMSLSFFFLFLYIWWIFMEFRTKKTDGDKFFTASLKYIKWYVINFKSFLKGEKIR